MENVYALVVLGVLLQAAHPAPPPSPLVHDLSAARLWIPATLLALGFLLLLVLPFIIKTKDTIAETFVMPSIDAHNLNEDAHPRLHEAILLLQQSISNLQAQIDNNEKNSRDRLSDIRGQLEMAVDLLKETA